jgi:hypothetical protein
MVRIEDVPTLGGVFQSHMMYHHGKGETIRAKNPQVDIGKPIVI